MMSFTHTTSRICALCSLIALVAVLCIFFAPDHAFAQYKFVPLTGVPGVDPNNVNLVGYINALYILAISLGALFGVIKIAIAGVKYTTSEVVTSKEDAKNDITGALLGLAILLATYVALYTINPELTNLRILGNAKPSTLTAPTTPGGAPSVTSAAPGTVTTPGAVRCEPTEVKFTNPDGTISCGTAYNQKTTSAADLTQAKAQCEASGGVFSPRNIRNGAQITRQFVCSK